jgi:microcystin-dependent protein
MVWNNTTNAQCPLYAPGPGAPIARGVSAQADWEALNVLSMPINTGAVISNIGNGHVVGEFGGTDTVSLTANQNGLHNHTASSVVNTNNASLNGNIVFEDSVAHNRNFVTGSGGNVQINGAISVTTTIGNSGTGAAHNNIQPTTYIPYIIKL